MQTAISGWPRAELRAVRQLQRCLLRRYAGNFGGNDSHRKLRTWIDFSGICEVSARSRCSKSRRLAFVAATRHSDPTHRNACPTHKAEGGRRRVYFRGHQYAQAACANGAWHPLIRRAWSVGRSARYGGANSDGRPVVCGDHHPLSMLAPQGPADVSTCWNCAILTPQATSSRTCQASVRQHTPRQQPTSSIWPETRFDPHSAAHAS